jgi:hypothetical protein
MFQYVEFLARNFLFGKRNNKVIEKYQIILNIHQIFPKFGISKDSENRSFST